MATSNRRPEIGFQQRRRRRLPPRRRGRLTVPVEEATARCSTWPDLRSRDERSEMVRKIFKLFLFFIKNGN
jgi:hypothetical protein